MEQSLSVADFISGPWKRNEEDNHLICKSKDASSFWPKQNNKIEHDRKMYMYFLFI